MKNVIESGSSEKKRDWFTEHVLSKEQLAQLILNKIERAKLYQEATKKVLALTKQN
jgi:hypothetical protein